MLAKVEAIVAAVYDVGVLELAGISEDFNNARDDVVDRKEGFCARLIVFFELLLFCVV